MKDDTASADLLLTNAVILTMDDTRRVIVNGAVAVKDDRIVAVGASRTLSDAFHATSVIDCEDGLVHPGLIDAHVHPQQHLSRSTLPDILAVREADHWASHEGALTEANRIRATELACLEMLRNGTTCFVAMGGDPDITAQTAANFGIRVRFAGTVWDEPGISGVTASTTEDALSELEVTLKRYPPGTAKMVQAAAGTVGMGRSSDALLRGVRELANEHDVFMFMHQSFSMSDYEYVRMSAGKSPIRHLDDLGILDGPIMLIHTNCMDDEELSIVTGNENVSVVHCPAASLRSRTGAFRAGRFREMNSRGVQLALGSDAGNSSDNLDVTLQMYLAVMLHGEDQATEGLSAERALEMATVDAARQIGEAGALGAIAPGHKADLVVHSSEAPETVPMIDPATNLVYSSRSRTVKSVIIDGQPVIQDNVLVRADEKKLLRDAASGARLAYDKGAYRVPQRWPLS